MLRLLLFSKADINHKDTLGRTALDVAIASQGPKHQELRKLLQAWPNIRIETLHCEFNKQWQDFCTNPDIVLGQTHPVKEILAQIDTEGDLAYISKRDGTIDKFGMAAYQVWTI